jgi:hypothetical protein
MTDTRATPRRELKSAVTIGDRAALSVRPGRGKVNTTGGGHAGLHFLALQRGIGRSVRTREATDGADIAEQSAAGQHNASGVLQYSRPGRRGNYLVPPRSLQALPSANPTASTPQGVAHAST